MNTKAKKNPESDRHYHSCDRADPGGVHYLSLCQLPPHRGQPGTAG